MVSLALSRFDFFFASSVINLIYFILAVDTLKKEKVKLKEEKGKGPMMEEFMDGRAKSSNDFIEEKNWMSSAQLWISTPVHSEQSNKNQDSVLSLKSVIINP